MALVILTTLTVIFNFLLKWCASNPSPVDPTSTTVMEGTNVTLFCTIVKNSSEAVSWTSSHSLSILSTGKRIARGGLVSTSQYDRLSISGNSDLGEYNLNFRNVQPEDSGQYSCGYFSVSQRKAIFSPKAVLTVISPPVCEHYPQNLELSPGESIQMVCTSQNNRPNTDLTWLRNGQSLRGPPKSPTELSNTISYLLTEDDYDQPFTCIENMSPLSYVPHCSITPLRKTRKPVHIANSPDIVTVGGISLLTCLTNQSFDSLSYRWLVDSSLVSSTSKIYSFGPVSQGDNGTSITCEVYRDSELYGTDEISIIVTSETEAENVAAPFIVDKTTPKTFQKSTFTHMVTGNTRNMFDDEAFTIPSSPIKDTVVASSETFIPNPVEGYVILFVVFSAFIGVLLIIAIVCLAMVLARYKKSPNTDSQEKIDTSSTIEMREPSDLDYPSSINEANMINEHIEAKKYFPPHYHTLEPDSRSSERKERRASDCSVPYSVVSKNKKTSKKGEDHLGNVCNGGDLAYAVTPVPMTNGRRHMSAKRPLPERPDGSPEYKMPCRSFSTSQVDSMQNKCKIGKSSLSRDVDNLGKTPMEENSVEEVVKRRVPSNGQANLFIETEYTEVRDGDKNLQETLLKSEEKAYEFTTVYDSLEDEKNNVLPSNPDNGFHDKSSTESAEVDNGEECQKSDTTTSLPNSNFPVKLEADDNLYASLEDCSV